MPNQEKNTRSGLIVVLKPMPKQVKEGGINPAFNPRRVSFKTEQRGGNLPPRCLLFLHQSRSYNKRETRFDLYPESWTFFKRDSVISGIELDS